MSFILDALKKSENERQRQTGPSLADIPVRRARNDRPWWAVAVAALLVVNLGVLLVVLMRDRGTSAAAPVPQATTVAPSMGDSSAGRGSQERPTSQPAVPPRTNSTPVAAMPAAPRTNPAVQSLAEAAGSEAEMMSGEEVYETSIASAAVVPAGPPIVRPITPPTVTPLPNQATFAARDRAGSAPPEDEMLPTHGSLVAGGTNLPDMRLDIHVYSPNPRERFVFVNMRKYVEGESLAEGGVLERITADGAILSQNGLRFLLPRQ